VTFTPTDAADDNTATATVTLNVADFTLNTSGGVTTQTVAAGGAATFTFSVSPVGSATLLMPVTLSVSGLPSGATAMFTPPVVPTGSPLTGVSLVVQLPSSAAAPGAEPRDYNAGAPFALALFLLPLLATSSLRKRMRLTPAWATALLFAGLSLGAMLGMTGCAGSNNSSAGSGSGSTTYTLVVTETSGNLQHSFNMTLVVEK
jgi:hypothetical protein